MLVSFLKERCALLFAPLFFLIIVFTFRFESIIDDFAGANFYLLLILLILFSLSLVFLNYNRSYFSFIFLFFLFLMVCINIAFAKNVTIAVNYNVLFLIIILSSIVIIRSSEQFINLFLDALFVYIFFLAVIGIIQFVFFKYGLKGMYLWAIPVFDSSRITSFVGQANILATYINIGIVLLLFKNKWFSNNFIYYLFYCIFAFVLVYTKSRAGELVFIISLLSLILLLYKGRIGGEKYKTIFIFFIIFFLFKYISISTFDFFGGGRSVFTGEEGIGVSSRIVLWLTAIILFIKNPLTGIGAGNFNTEDALVQPIVVEKLNMVYNNIRNTYWAHNDFLQFSSEYGILFLLIFLLICYKLYKNYDSSKLKYYLIILVIFLSSCFSWQLHYIPLLIIFAMVLVYLLISDNDNKMYCSVIPNVLVSVFLIIALFFVVKNYLYDVEYSNELHLVEKFGVTENFIEDIDDVKNKNDFIYSYANEDFVYWATYNKNKKLAIMLSDNVNDAIEFNKSFLTMYSKAWNMIYSTDNFLSDYDDIVDRIKKGIDLKPDYEKSWTLLHYANMKKASEVTGRPFESFLPSEEDKKNLLDKMQKNITKGMEPSK